MRERKAPDNYIDAWLEWCSLSELPEPDNTQDKEQWLASKFWNPDNWEPLYVSDLGIFFFKRINDECPHPRHNQEANFNLKLFRDWLRLKLGKRRLDIGFVTFGTLPEHKK